MVICNGKLFIAGHRCGVIHNPSFWCTLITNRIGADVWTLPDKWFSQNHHPIARALLDETLTWKQVRAIHESFLDELDQCGNGGLNLSGAIEQVFGRARNKNIIIRYKNEARPLLSYETSTSAGTDG